MAQISNKHGDRASRVFYPGFDGGINLSVPPEILGKNEFRDAVNVEFSALTGALRVRGGLVWSSRFPQTVNSVVPVPGRHGFLARQSGSKKAFYFLWNNIWNVSGNFSGNGDLSAVTWDKTGDLLVASGGKLQIFHGSCLPELETIENSPEHCRIVFIRAGRVGVICDDDTIYFSAVGDCSSWDNDPSDDSSAQFVQIGYKDGMNINAVAPLSRDLIIFKSPDDEPEKGKILRLTGDYPDWQVLETAQNIGTFGQRTVQAIGNDVFFITPAGLATLGNVTSYGEVKTNWPDRKVSNTLTYRLERSSRLWSVPLKQQLWIQASDNDDDLWILDYARNIWTKIKFPLRPFHVAEVGNLVFIFFEQDLYQVNEWFTHDEIKNNNNEFEIKNINANITLGTLLQANQLLIKGALATFNIVPESNAVLRLGNKFKMEFKNNSLNDYVYDNQKFIFDNDDSLFPAGNTLTARRKFIVRGWNIAPEIEITGGGCQLSTLGLEIVEV